MLGTMRDKRTKVDTRVGIAKWFLEQQHGTAKGKVAVDGGGTVEVVPQGEIAKRFAEARGEKVPGSA